MILAGITLFDSNHLLMLFFPFLFVWGSLLFAFWRGERFARKFLLVILWANFALHFLRLLNPFYLSRGIKVLFYASPNNLCALLVLAAPFLFLYGKSLAKEYLVVMSIAGGVIALLFPSVPIDVGERIQEWWTFLEVLRYCLCHCFLLVSAFLILFFRFHEINYHRLPIDGLMFLGALALIFLNKLVFWKLLNPDPWYLFFDTEFENPSYIFGIPLRLNGNPVFAFIDKYLAWPFLTYSLPNGAKAYLPILWLIPTLYFVLLPLIFLLVYLPFDGRRLGKDLVFLFQRRKKETQGGEK